MLFMKLYGQQQSVWFLKYFAENLKHHVKTFRQLVLSLWAPQLIALGCNNSFTAAMKQACECHRRWHLSHSKWIFCFPLLPLVIYSKFLKTELRMCLEVEVISEISGSDTFCSHLCEDAYGCMLKHVVGIWLCPSMTCWSLTQWHVSGIKISLMIIIRLTRMVLQVSHMNSNWQ